MTVFVTLLSGHRIPVDTNPTDTVDTVRRKVHAKEGINHRTQRLMFCGRELRDGTMESHGITRGATLHLLVLSPEEVVKSESNQAALAGAPTPMTKQEGVETV